MFAKSDRIKCACKPRSCLTVHFKRLMFHPFIHSRFIRKRVLDFMIQDAPEMVWIGDKLRIKFDKTFFWLALAVVAGLIRKPINKLNGVDLRKNRDCIGDIRETEI